MLGILKLIRIFRINKVIIYLNVKQEIKLTIKLIKLIFFLLMYVHFTGCLWFYLISLNKVWIPPCDYIDGF